MMAVSSFSCCTGTPLCSITDLHGGKILIPFDPGPWIIKLLHVCCAVGEGGFARGAGQRPLFYRTPCEAACRG